MQNPSFPPLLPPPPLEPPHAAQMPFVVPPPPRALGQTTVVPGVVPVVEDGHTLGLAFLLTGVGSALGLAYAGAFGGIGGGLAGGALVNVWQAYSHATKGTEADDREAIISGTYGVLGAIASVYLLYKGKTAKPNHDGLIGEE